MGHTWVKVPPIAFSLQQLSVSAAGNLGPHDGRRHSHDFHTSPCYSTWDPTRPSPWSMQAGGSGCGVPARTPLLARCRRARARLETDRWHRQSLHYPPQWLLQAGCARPCWCCTPGRWPRCSPRERPRLCWPCSGSQSGMLPADAAQLRVHVRSRVCACEGWRARLPEN